MLSSGHDPLKAREPIADTRLRSAMEQLAEEYTRAVPPPEIRERLLAEFDRCRAPAARRPLAPAALMALAAAVAMLAILIPRHATKSLPPEIPLPPRTSRAPQQLQAVTLPPARPAVKRVAEPEPEPFVELPWTVPLGPGERSRVVRMDLPVAALIAAGFPLRADPAEAARADVLVGLDGRARAVRLLSISNTLSYRRIQ